MNTKIVINEVYELFTDPLIYLTSGAHGIEKVIEHGKPNSICFINLIWVFSPFSLRHYLPWLKKLKERKIQPIIIGSCTHDMLFLRMFGIRCLFANQNQFLIDKNIPLRMNHQQFDYDAFYAAQARPFKRMHLASNIERLYILTYRWTKELNATRILRDFEPSVGHATYNKSFLEFDAVVKVMHKSACALALSRKEGAMWAACEALLSGIPVVSTKSIGGRDRYFDSRTTKIVPARPSAIKDAVEEFKSNPPDPTEVRRITLEKMEEDRKITIKYFQNVILNGANYSDNEIYKRLFQDGPARTSVDFQSNL
jgi:glycosyltransferase involved in cell wall biosynthesis